MFNYPFSQSVYKTHFQQILSEKSPAPAVTAKSLQLLFNINKPRKILAVKVPPAPSCDSRRDVGGWRCQAADSQLVGLGRKPQVIMPLYFKQGTPGDSLKTSSGLISAWIY